jgi:hypothetical protein
MLTKMVLGVILPLALFVAGLAILFQVESSKGPDYGIVGMVKMWIVYIPGIPLVLLANTILMLRQWRSVAAVCLMGLIVPAVLIITEWCLLVFWRM